eukprot:10230690-Prorocentrum_lima.AAC.1
MSPQLVRDLQLEDDSHVPTGDNWHQFQSASDDGKQLAPTGDGEKTSIHPQWKTRWEHARR